MTRSRLDTPEFFAPLPLAAVALMAVNDRWWKPAFHNTLTGKLSDLAICFFLPLFVSALLGIALRATPSRRLLAGALIAGVVFATLEWGPAADWSCRALLPVLGAPLGLHGPFHMTSDATDLAALAMIPLAWWYGTVRTRAPRRVEVGA